MIKKISRYSIGVILAVIFLYFAFKGINFSDLIDSLKNANYFYLFLFFVVSIASHFIRAWRWRYFLDHIKKNIRMRNLFSGLMIGYFINNFLPRGGEIARPYALGKLENISMSSTLATVIVERVLDVLTLMVLIVVMLILYQEKLILNFPWLNIATIIAFIVSFAGIGFLILLSLKTEETISLIHKFTFFLPEKFSGKLESLLRSFLQGFQVIKEPKNYLIIFVLTVLMWFLYALQWYVPFYSFGMVDKYSLTLGSAIILNSIVAIGIAIPVPGGTGTYHAFCIQALIGLFLVEKSTAAAYATATHAIGMIGLTIIGATFFVTDNITLSKITENSTVESKN